MKNTRPLKPCFKASLKADGVFELTIYEEIGENFWSGGGITASSIKQEIESAGKIERIAVRINSPGGDAFEGVAIHSVLASAGKPVDVYVDGIAASAASIIAMAGDTITMSSGAMMMIHDAWSICMGNQDDMRKMADTLEKVSGSIAQVYSDRTGKDVSEIGLLMKTETWLSAADCLRDGFATAIAKKDNTRAMALAKSFKSLARFAHNLPEPLKADSTDEGDEGTADNPDECGCNCSNCMADSCKDCSYENCMDKDCADCPMQQKAGARHAGLIQALEDAATREGILQENVMALQLALGALEKKADEPGPVTDPPTVTTNLSQYEARLAMLRGA